MPLEHAVESTAVAQDAPVEPAAGPAEAPVETSFAPPPTAGLMAASVQTAANKFTDVQTRPKELMAPVVLAPHLEPETTPAPQEHLVETTAAPPEPANKDNSRQQGH